MRVRTQKEGSDVLPQVRKQARKRRGEIRRGALKAESWSRNCLTKGCGRWGTAGVSCSAHGRASVHTAIVNGRTRCRAIQCCKPGLWHWFAVRGSNKVGCGVPSSAGIARSVLLDAHRLAACHQRGQHLLRGVPASTGGCGVAGELSALLLILPPCCLKGACVLPLPSDLLEE